LASRDFEREFRNLTQIRLGKIATNPIELSWLQRILNANYANLTQIRLEKIASNHIETGWLQKILSKWK
jgi:hypothetical protein